jgi:amino acid adenylation domain-containing protein
MSASSNRSLPQIPNQKVGAQCSSPFTRIKREDFEQSIAKRFEQQVSLFPERIAIKLSNQTFNYSELNRLANRAAHLVLSRTESKNTPIAINIDDDVSAIIAVLGVLKSGNFYVPLNRELPRHRLRTIVEDSTAKTILTYSPCLRHTQDLAGDDYQILNVDDVEVDISEENPGVPVAAHDLAHIIYTTGSTGIPKGVVENHRNLIHHVMRVTNTAFYTTSDRMTLLRPPNSGGALMNVYSALLNGACLFPVNLKTEGIQRLIQLLIEERITVYHSSATVFRHLLQNLETGTQLPHLRLIRLGSEQLLKKDIELYREHFPSSACTIVNSLNCTEANTLCQFFINHEVEIIGDIVPVGFPAEDMKVMLFDELGKEASGGEIGQIAVESRFLSPGYWRNPKLTKTAFIPLSNSDARLFLSGDMGRMRSDGCLEYLGRKDFQVKIRGHKVHTNEVELALLGVTDIEQAAVLATEEANGDTRLTAYLAVKDNATLKSNQLRMMLERTLPSYMVPAAFVAMKSLPLTANGKIDRRALPAPPRSRPELDGLYVAPGTAIERVLASIWSEVLKIDQVGRNDHLLEIGGDSLLASAIISKVNRIFSLDLAPYVLFQTNTISAFADEIMTQESNPERLQIISQRWLEIDAMPADEVKKLLEKERKPGNAE